MHEMFLYSHTGILKLPRCNTNLLLPYLLLRINFPFLLYDHYILCEIRMRNHVNLCIQCYAEVDIEWAWHVWYIIAYILPYSFFVCDIKIVRLFLIGAYCWWRQLSCRLLDVELNKTTFRTKVYMLFSSNNYYTYLLLCLPFQKISKTRILNLANCRNIVGQHERLF